ncbi:hypothetical protein [Sellimonas sp.]|uniref:hypothetical protein n=1 Tax=Sellimonas sp. TaxID=2021466 RepID=UPI000B37EA2B|nr:hypothetical protein [Sellimonas sp.]OUP64165.1 hypothetical protein B5F13_08825 [Drancourtella sp. An177]
MDYLDEHKYDDIINMSHHVSDSRPRMSMLDRAAQFSPFATLTGYDAAVKETARLTDNRIGLDEYEKTALDEKLRIALEHSEAEITILYFKPDERKAGGAYISATGRIREIDDYERMVILHDGLKIPIEDIYGNRGRDFQFI